MTTAKNSASAKHTGSAPPPQAGAPKTDELIPGAPAPAVRTRSAVSKERRLATALTNVIKAVDLAKLKDPAIEAARALVKDFSDKILKPTEDRIKAITLEMQEAVKDPLKIDASKMKALSLELNRLQTKLKAIQTG